MFHFLSDFSTAPTNLFSQLYTVYGEIAAGGEKAVVPLVYAFLPNKIQRTYERMLEVIRDKVALNPQTWIVDFEKRCNKCHRKVLAKDDQRMLLSLTTVCVQESGRAGL